MLIPRPPRVGWPLSCRVMQPEILPEVPPAPVRRPMSIPGTVLPPTMKTDVAVPKSVAGLFTSPLYQPTTLPAPIAFANTRYSPSCNPLMLYVPSPVDDADVVTENEPG